MSDWLALHAVVWHGAPERAVAAVRTGAEAAGYRLVADADLAAAVTPAPSASPDRGKGGTGRIGREELRTHERVVESLLRRRSLVPLSPGFRARGEEAVRRFLTRQRLPLREALEYFEDTYEVRVYLTAAGEEHAGELFRTLRPYATAARRASDSDSGRFGAAFLLQRSAWIRFVETASDWEVRNPGIDLDVTGPWAPYDFVELVPLSGEGGSAAAPEGSPAEEA